MAGKYTLAVRQGGDLSETVAVTLSEVWRAVSRGAMGEEWIKPEVLTDVKVESEGDPWGLITPIAWDYAWKQLNGIKPRVLGIDHSLLDALFFFASFQVLLGHGHAAVWLQRSRPLNVKFREMLFGNGLPTSDQWAEMGRLQVIYNVDQIVEFDPTLPRRGRRLGVPFPTPKAFRKFWEPSKEDIESAENRLNKWVASMPELKLYHDPVLLIVETV